MSKFAPWRRGIDATVAVDGVLSFFSFGAAIDDVRTGGATGTCTVVSDHHRAVSFTNDCDTRHRK